MYLNFYNLKKEPFQVTPDPEFLFLSDGHKEALGSIIYGVEKRKGFLTITGEVGVGKTTIIRSYLERVDQQQSKIIYIFNANVSFKGLLKTIYEELDIHPETSDVYEVANQLQKILIDEYKHGRNLVLIVDEAQNMPVETVENLRMLSNLETSTDKLLQIVLIGQPEFEQMLNLNKLRQLKQRIAVRTTISPLTQKESIAYIQHRLAKVIINDVPIFKKRALKLIAKQAKGIPRNLNILCDNALITGYGYQQRPVTSRIAKEVISDFEGRRKSLLLRWWFATSMAFLLLISGFLFYPHENNILSSMKNNNDLYQNTKVKSIEEKEIKSVVKKETTEPIKKNVPAITTVQEVADSPLSHSPQVNLNNVEEEITMEKEIHESPRHYTLTTGTVKKQQVPAGPAAEEDELFVKKAIPEQAKNTVSVTTTVEKSINPTNTFMHIDDSNIACIKDNDIHEIKSKESLSTKSITIDENYETRSLTTKLERERKELEILKSKFQERINAEMSRLDKLIINKLQSTSDDNLVLSFGLENSE